MRLRQLLGEIFNNRYEYEISHHHRNDDNGKTGYTKARFYPREGNAFKVTVDHSNDYSHVEFAKNGKYDLTHGTSLTDTAKVFSTVHHIIKQHLNQFPESKGVTFSSKEPSRTKTYHHFAHVLSGSTKDKKNYESDDDSHGETYFTIHKKDMKL